MKTRTIGIVAGVLFVILLFGGTALGALMWRVHQSKLRYSGMAQQAHLHVKNDVAALIDFMNSDEHSFQERNHAVWTLGRLRDPRALPSLEAAYTGKPCDHEKALCQYELEKAIKLCGGTPNPPRTAPH